MKNSITQRVSCLYRIMEVRSRHNWGNLHNMFPKFIWTKVWCSWMKWHTNIVYLCAATSFIFKKRCTFGLIIHVVNIKYHSYMNTYSWKNKLAIVMWMYCLNITSLLMFCIHMIGSCMFWKNFLHSLSTRRHTNLCVWCLGLFPEQGGTVSKLHLRILVKPKTVKQHYKKWNIGIYTVVIKAMCTLSDVTSLDEIVWICTVQYLTHRPCSANALHTMHHPQQHEKAQPFSYMNSHCCLSLLL